MEWQENKTLKIQNLRVDFLTKTGTIQAVKGVNLTVPKGKITALVGESGSGKSVTSLAVLGLLPRNGKIVEGEITAEGMEFGKLSKEQKKRWNGSTVGMIFQDPSASLNPLYTVGNQITEGIRQRQKMKKEEAEKLALSYLKAVKLPNPKQLMKKYPFELSGGMCQRVMIAIAMALKPKYLIADEPTTALDVTVQRQILSEIYRMSREQKMGILFITHDLGVVAHVADRIAVMYAGKIVEYGTAEDIFYDPLHPYTWSLLASMPDTNLKAGEELSALHGTPPNMLFPPKGDAFAERNPWAVAIDFEKEPPMFKVSDTHYAATWLLHPNAPKVNRPEVLERRIANSIKRREGKVNG